MKSILKVLGFIVALAIVGALGIGALACGFSAGQCNPIKWWMK